MAVKSEQVEKNLVKLTFEVSSEDFAKAINRAYAKNAKKYSVPGFRKGKVPRQMIERMYGAGVFYEDAANELMPVIYERELDAAQDLEVASRPEITDVNIEKGKPFSFVAMVALKPEIELGKYKGVKVEKTDVSVSDEEINERLDREVEKNARIIDVKDRAVQDGDMITLNFEGFVDDVPFEGGKGEHYPLTIGSGQFIPGFEDQLIGVNIDEETTVNVTFPEEYQEKSLAGKDAKFVCTVTEIREKEKPELNDEFAQDAGGFDTLDEYKEDIKKKITEEKEAEAKRDKEDRVIKAIVEDSKMDIPDAIIDTEAEKLIDNYAMNLSYQGLSIDQYYQMTGLTREKLMEQMRPQAEDSVKSRYVLEAVVDAENIEVSEEDYDKELDKMAESYQMEKEKVSEFFSEKDIKNIKRDIAIRKAVDLVRDNAVEA